jgi:hypothetical protein
MAATVQIRKITGAVSGPTSTNITSGSLKLGTSDHATSPSAIPVPTSGSNHSYWVNTQLHCTVAPDTALNNIKWYTDGSNGFGTGITGVVTTGSLYASAIGTAGSSGNLLNGTNNPCVVAASDMFLYTSSCKFAVSGSIGATTGSFSNYVVYQVSVISTAAAGNSSEETLTWQWDES